MPKSGFIIPLSLLFLFGMFATGSPAEPYTLTLEGDSWPPYVISSSQGGNGSIVDVAMEALARAGYKIDFLATPWTRAIKDTENGTVDGAVGIYFSEAEEHHFVVPEEELGLSVNKFYVIKGNAWRYTGTTSLEHITLGIIDSYDYGEINPYIADKRNANSIRIAVVFGDKALQKNFLKLLAGRIDALVEDQAVVLYIASQMGISDKIEEAGVSLPANKVGIAFSPKKPMAKEYAKALASGIRQLRASGDLQKILDAYGIKDWK